MLASSSSGVRPDRIDAQHVRHAAIAERRCVRCHTLDRAAEMPHRGERHRRRARRPSPGDVRNHRVAEVRQVERLEVAAIPPFREQPVVETLDRAIGHLAAEIEHRLAKFAQGLDHRFALVRRAVVNRRHCEHARAVGFRRKIIRIGDRREFDEAAKPFGSGRHEVAPSSDDRRCVGFRIQRRAEHQLRRDRMQSKLEGRNDAEIPAAAAHGPEQVGMARCRRHATAGRRRSQCPPRQRCRRRGRGSDATSRSRLTG